VIKHGQEWGSNSLAPDDLVVVTADAGLAKAISDGYRNITVAGGDMWRTIGAHSQTAVPGESARCLPIDVMDVHCQLVDGTMVSRIAVAHVVIRRSNIRGGWLRGPVTVIANAQFLGHWDIAPRGHPNDGRVEITQVDPSMSLRQRLSARSRIKTGAHVPHPSIAVRSDKDFDFRCEDELIKTHSNQIVWIDGQRIGRVQRLSLEVRSDHAFLWM
jgi:hypothetical protein